MVKKTEDEKSRDTVPLKGSSPEIETDESGIVYRYNQKTM
jgi:hypothetical protein